MKLKWFRKAITAGLIVASLSAGILVKHIRARREASPLTPPANMMPIDQGTFQMGSKQGALDEKPVHLVKLSSFLMDRDEVTYRDYREFIEECPEWRKDSVDIDCADLNYLCDWDGLSYSSEKAEHPIVYISWFAAKAYAEWIGKALPSEAQWEYASRGGFKNMDYPWGKDFKSHLTQWRESDVRGTVKGGRYSINGYGLQDIIGNAAEWTVDGYEMYMEEEQVDPSPSINRHLKVIRGGSWKSDWEDLRVSARRASRPNVCRPDVGFRCVFNQTMTRNRG
ncbi:MAG: SUMF1/EgtB/PvdO family nonheme iron enzyme [Kiritimatiellia bacterium]|jgi:formylglycine-generating enzyme required for sulfatase activity|nr:SUMF1/EgtB/PvdO family nonheme iron enzyme [Kiritimatiellia bacterium]MDP6809867.1 SUMF1/EgtB/PvdO family nonheme iron enzyme [Kiritimatiellia bacterium]MDP7024259.1 SUMF1/EgtB/PvdO family nonheme iron enzyme [Kiritimatiellia bacterium]